MPKASKASNTSKTSAPSLSDDISLVALDFAAFGHDKDNAEVRAAILRRVTDAKIFNDMRCAAIAAWLTNEGYEIILAKDLVNKSKFQGPNGILKGVKNRDAKQEGDYKRGVSAWAYYLKVQGIETLNTSKQTRKPRTPTPKPDAPKPDAPKPEPAPIAPQAFVASKLTNLNDVTAQVGTIVANLGKVGNINAKVLQGDKGAAIRDLIAHNLREMKRIEAMEG